MPKVFLIGALPKSFTNSCWRFFRAASSLMVIFFLLDKSYTGLVIKSKRIVIGAFRKNHDKKEDKQNPGHDDDGHPQPSQRLFLFQVRARFFAALFHDL